MARSTDAVKSRRRALAYRISAEASLLHGNGTVTQRDSDLDMIQNDPAYSGGGLWTREDWCMAFCLMAAMVEAGDA